MTYKLSINSKYQTLIPLVKHVGEEILKIYNSNIETTIKHDNSPVTQADILANDIIMKHIKDNFPEYGVISEELKDNEETYKKEKIFVIDPIDGTKGFIDKNGEFCIMIGILKNFEPIFGLIYKPIQKELIIAEKEKGAYLINSSEKEFTLKTTKIDEFENSRMLRSRNHYSVNEKYLSENLKLPKYIKMGSIGIKVTKIASQENELYINLSKSLGKWDTCAPQIILEESGGKVYDKYGNKLDYKTHEQKMINGFIGTNSKLSKNKILKNIFALEIAKKIIKQK